MTTPYPSRLPRCRWLARPPWRQSPAHVLAGGAGLPTAVTMGLARPHDPVVLIVVAVAAWLATITIALVAELPRLYLLFIYARLTNRGASIAITVTQVSELLAQLPQGPGHPGDEPSGGPC